MLRTQLSAMVQSRLWRKTENYVSDDLHASRARTARMLLRQVIDELAEEGHQPPQKIQVGMMVEVPAAVLMLERFVREVDFISIGTNDLICTRWPLIKERIRGGFVRRP
ncbi:MAG: putative PEP-binding protein [Pirellulaceae bacterium]